MIAFFAELFDSKPRLAILIAMPRPSSDAQRLAARYNIEIVGGESAEELTKGLAELLGKVETIIPSLSRVREGYLLAGDARSASPIPPTSIRPNGTDSNPSLSKASLEARLQVGEVSDKELPLVSRKSSFEATLSEAVDDSLMSLGRAAGASIYARMERECGLKKDEIPQRLQDFDSTIRKILSSGGPIIENLILKRLCEKLHVDSDSIKKREFLAAVAEVKGRCD